MKAFLKFANDNHWYLIGIVLISIAIFWTYGCESEVESMLDPTKTVNRHMLEAELDYLIADVENKVADLNRQDEIKQALLDSVNILGTTGNINPSGLLNLVATIGAITFGLNRNQKVKALKKNPTV